jgi:hypothetical protein
MSRVLFAAVALSAIAVLEAEAIQITAPVSGTVVTPGQSVTVTVAAGPDETITRVAFATSDEVVEAPAGSLQAMVVIPRDAVGPEFVIAYATLANGQASIVSVELVANPGPLNALHVAAPFALGTVGEVQQIEVTGAFADGVMRDLTHSERGTSYRSTNTAVLGVLPSGVVQARTRGTAQVVVSSRGRSRVVTILVGVPHPPPHRIPVPDAGADLSVASQSIVRLNGSGSQDPDGDPIVYRWTQETGPGVVLHDAETDHPGFVAPRVTVPTVLEFSLFVVDSRGAQSFPDVVRVTVAP